MKKIILALTLLFLTGCNVDYNVLVDENRVVHEEIIATIDNDTTPPYYSNVEEYLIYFTEMYKDSQGFEDYDYEIKIGEEESSVIVTRTYSNISEFTNSQIMKSLFDAFYITDSSKYLSFETGKNLFLEYSRSGETLDEYEQTYESFMFNFQFYNEVIESDADKIDKKTNTYTWDLLENEGTMSFRTGPDVLYMVMINDFISENIVTISIIGGVLAALIIYGLYLFIRVKRNDKI